MALSLFRIQNNKTTGMIDKLLKPAIFAGIALVTFVFFWTNRFEYQHAGTTQVLVRINRFTGQHCYLTTDRGWSSQLMVKTAQGDKWSQYEVQTEADKNQFAFLDAVKDECR